MPQEPEQPTGTTPAVVPLEDAPAAEYIKRREAGETGAPVAPAVEAQPPVEKEQVPSEAPPAEAERVEAEKPAATLAVEAETAAAQEAAPGEPKKGKEDVEDEKKLPPWMQKRLGKMTRKQREAETRALEADERTKEAEGRAAELQRQLDAAKPAQPKAETAAATPVDKDDPEPKEDDEKFASYTDFLKDWNRWDHRQIDKVAAKETATKAATEARAIEEKREKTALDAFYERRDEFTAEHSDFIEAVAPLEPGGAAPLPSHMLAGVVDLENGPAVLYHLGKNPEEAKKLLALPPIAAVLALGRLSAKLAPAPAATPPPATTQTVPKANTPAVSQAPPPAAPLGGTARSAVTPLEDLPPSEYFKRRDEQRFGRRS